MRIEIQLGNGDIWISHVLTDKHCLSCRRENDGNKGIEGKGWKGSQAMKEHAEMAVRFMGRTG